MTSPWQANQHQKTFTDTPLFPLTPPPPPPKNKSHTIVLNSVAYCRENKVHVNSAANFLFLNSRYSPWIETGSSCLNKYSCLKIFPILKSPVIKRTTSNEIKIISVSGGTGKVNKQCISPWGCKGGGGRWSPLYSVHGDVSQGFDLTVLNKVRYLKIPKINPGAYFFLRGFIYGGKFAFQNRLGWPYSWKEIYRFGFVLLFIWGQFSSTSPPPPGGAYIWRGDLTEGFLHYEFGGLIFGEAYFKNFMVGTVKRATK